MYHRPVCAMCEIEMIPKMNGVGVLDMAKSIPYKVWDADLWQCPSCVHEIVVGFGCQPIAHWYEECFNRVLAGYERSSQLIISRDSYELKEVKR